MRCLPASRGRDAFLPFIALIERYLDVLVMDGGRDWRRQRLRGMPTWHVPPDARADRALDQAFADLTGREPPRAEQLQVMGRTLQVPLAAHGVARFDFAALCGRPLGAGDYLALATHYHTLVLDAVPRLSPNNYDEARRFITLIDSLYDHRVKLVASAEATPDQLYERGEGATAFERTRLPPGGNAEPGLPGSVTSHVGAAYLTLCIEVADCLRATPALFFERSSSVDKDREPPMRRFLVAVLLSITTLSGAVAQKPPPLPNPSTQPATPLPAPSTPHPVPGQIGRRVALVVGNNAYPENALASPALDARDMANVLRAAGFTMVGGGPVVDVGKRAFEAAIMEFGRQAVGAEAAVFYYSGHGMEWDQQNWMVPIDDTDGVLQNTPRVDVSVDLVLQQITAAHAKFSMVILDACRPNAAHPRPSDSAGAVDGTGRARAPGNGTLAAMFAPENTVVAFATQPGDYSYDGGPGENSLYTKQLIQVLKTPGLELFQVFNRAALATKEATQGKQRPWTNYSPISGEFFFFPRGSSVPQIVSDAQPARPAVRPPTPQPAPVSTGGGSDAGFAVINLSGMPVSDLRVSPASDRNWGDNRARDHAIRQGERLGIQLGGGRECQVDIRVILGNREAVASKQDTCRVSTLVIEQSGKVNPSNPDFSLTNAAGRPARAVYVSLTTETNWGQNRVRSPLQANGKVSITLPHGMGCTVDVRAEFTDGTSLERRKVDTCSLEDWSLR